MPKLGTQYISCTHLSACVLKRRSASTLYSDKWRLVFSSRTVFMQHPTTCYLFIFPAFESVEYLPARLLSELESPSWWPFGTVKLLKGPLEAKPKQTSPVSISGNKDGIIMCIPVIITERTDSTVKPGKLTLLASGLEISDSASHLLHRFEKKEVDDVKVHTPYEVSIRQRFIGKPDISYRLLSAKMPEAIPILEMQFIKKIQFMEDAVGLVGARRTSHQEDGGSSMWQAGKSAEPSCSK